MQDLAKARALLALARSLEDGGFSVHLQPRAGLDYFSAEPDEAKAQLAASTALMDDIEPGDGRSPPIIHVVSWSEGRSLADPSVIEESIRIARYALSEYRGRRARGLVPDMSADAEARARTEALLADARAVIAAIELSIESPWSARGLYEILASGFFPLPALAALRDEFAEAARWKTASIAGAVRVVDEAGSAIPVPERMREVVEVARRRASKRGLAASGPVPPGSIR